MAEFTDEFNEHSDALRETRKQDDFDNLQHTYSGVETGQQTRHGLSKDKSGSVAGGKRKSVAERIRETLDWLLLNNPEYAAVYHSVMDTVSRAEAATQSALDKAVNALETAKAELQDMLDRAPTLPDGRKVFLDKATGHVYAADGSRIPDELAAGIKWPEGAASQQDYSAKGKQIEELSGIVHELRDYQTNVLGAARDRIQDNENPLSPDQLEEVQRNIQEQMPISASREMNPQSQPDMEAGQTETLTIPKMPKG